MFNKNDPLIGAVQEVMKKNQAERDAVKAVNEKFGVLDRRALPHEQQANWDAAYKKVMTEGVQTLKEDYDPNEAEMANHAKKFYNDPSKVLASNARKIYKKHNDKAVTGMSEEEQIDEVLDTPGKRLKYYAKAAVSGIKANMKGDNKTLEKRTKGAEMAGRKTRAHIEKSKTVTESGDQKELEYHPTSELKDKDKKGHFTKKLKVVPKKKLDEKAKWRSTSVAKKVTSPDDPDSISYDYHHDNPRSTGAMRATSDKPDSYDGLNNRRKSDVVSRGARKGKITKDSANRLKDRIVGNHFQKEEKIEEVAPPGREDQVKALKKKVGKESAFKIAWASYNKKKGK